MDNWQVDCENCDSSYIAIQKSDPCLCVYCEQGNIETVNITGSWKGIQFHKRINESEVVLRNRYGNYELWAMYDRNIPEQNSSMVFYVDGVGYMYGGLYDMETSKVI